MGEPRNLMWPRYGRCSLIRCASLSYAFWWASTLTRIGGLVVPLAANPTGLNAGCRDPAAMQHPDFRCQIHEQGLGFRKRLAFAVQRHRWSSTAAKPTGDSHRMLAGGGTDGVLPAVAAVPPAGPNKRSLNHTLKVSLFFFLWYSFNVGYNITTKLVLNAVQIPWTLAVCQLLAGIPYVALVWGSGIRKAPRLRPKDLKVVVPVALMHTVAHLSAVTSIGAGAVGFVQIVKACEPLFTALFNALFLGHIMAWPVYMTLVPVVGGVALASLKELNFSPLAFSAAMTSNTFAASRSVFGKVAMGKQKGENMDDAGNFYAVMTIIASLALAPVAYYVEGRQFGALWAAAKAAGHNPRSMARTMALSGLFFYLYNEVAFYALNAVHPITHAVGNAIKRVVMVFVSIIVFNYRFTPLGMMGSAMAIGGVIMYGVAKNTYGHKEKRGPGG